MSKYLFENRAGVRGGTTRRNQYGNRVRGEFNEYQEPMGTPAPAAPNFFDERFGKRAVPPMSRASISPAPVVNPNLTEEEAAQGIGGGIASMVRRVLPPVVPPSSKGSDEDQFGKATRKTSTGGTEVWQRSETGGGRWVPTTSLTPISRGGTQGTVTDTGATPFDRRGQRTLQTTGGTVNEYDPRKDAGINVAPAGTVPGASRALVIDPKYQTPGASPFASISGGEMTQNGGVQQLASRAPAPAAPAMRPYTPPPTDAQPTMGIPAPALPSPVLPTVPAPSAAPRAIAPTAAPIASTGPGPATVNPFVAPRGDLGGAMSEIGSGISSLMNRVNRGISRTAAGPGVNLDAAAPSALPSPLPVAKETLPVALSEDEVRRRKLRNATASTF